jgi:hypothetical protein
MGSTVYLPNATVGSFYRIKDPFGTASLHEIQLSFTNFTIEQFSLRVGEVNGSVWLSDQLQLHKNEILVRIASYALEIML